MTRDVATDSEYMVMLGLYTGDVLTADDGGLVLVYSTETGPAEWGVPGAVLDALEGRGWVEVTEAGPVLTDRGRWWLAKWFKQKTKRELSRTAFRKTVVGRGCP